MIVLQAILKLQQLDCLTLIFSLVTIMLQAGVAELADAADLKSAGAILVGSSPTLGTNAKITTYFVTDITQ